MSYINGLSSHSRFSGGLHPPGGGFTNWLMSGSTSPVGVSPSNVIRWLKLNPRDHNGKSPHYMVHLLLGSSGLMRSQLNSSCESQIDWIYLFSPRKQIYISNPNFKFPNGHFQAGYILSGHQLRMFCLCPRAPGSILPIGTLEFGNWRLTFALSVFRFRE